jgi:2-aminoadipate transaminase
MSNGRKHQPKAPRYQSVAWSDILAGAGRSPRRSEIRDLLSITARKDVIGFGGGLTAPDLFPAAELTEALGQVLHSRPALALQYGPTEGMLELREVVAARLRRRGIACAAADVLITTGSQQALDLVAEALVDRGSPLLVEAPTYVGALQAFGGCEPDFVSFSTDEEGLSVDELTAWLARNDRRPSLLYTIPSFQNPSGVTMSSRRRKRVLAVLRTYGVPIVEDDPYGELVYEGEIPRPLRSMPGGEDVIYLGTFSKVLAPGIRVGYVVAPGPLRERLILLKQGRDLHTDALAQCMVAEYCDRFGLDNHIECLKLAYRERRDAMLDALERSMPEGVSWTKPAGGMFLWVTLPSHVSARALLLAAVEGGVTFVPGTAFHADGTGDCSFRLNFSSSSLDEISKGIRILSGLVSDRVTIPA